MKIEYDPGHDILNIEFIPDCPILESVEIDGVILDYSKDKRIISIEILDAGKRTQQNPLDMINFSVVKEKTLA